MVAMSSETSYRVYSEKARPSICHLTARPNFEGRISLPALLLPYKLAHARMRHFQVQLDPDLLLRLSSRDPDLFIFLADSGQDVFHLLLPEDAA